MLSTCFQFVLACSVRGQPDNSVLSPPVKTSSKKFFDKDYTWDKRPAVDVLHFKHPYPVVQDSDDFDRDFVKDENKDNGEFLAQTEYDRLRHKLAKEKAKVTKATESMKKAEKEVEDVMRREASAKEREQIRIQEKKEEMEKEQKEKEQKEEEERTNGQTVGGNTTEDEKKGEGRKYVVPESKSPGGIASPGEVEIATGDSEKAMDKLEECKEQLKKAQDKLKNLMKELQEAKKQQEETQAALNGEEERLKIVEAEQTAAHAAAQKEYKEYIDAKEAYDKQQYLVLKMQADIEAAARKVRAVRDAEDKGGGVYSTPRNKATHRSVASPLTFILSVWTTCTLFQ